MGPCVRVGGAGWLSRACIVCCFVQIVARRARATGMHLVERADAGLLRLLNSVAGKSPFFDHTVNLISRLHFFKGVFVFSVLWGAWFARSRDDGGKSRRDVVLTLLAAAVAAPLSRVLQMALPLRVRPIFNSTLNFSAPVVFDPGELPRW